MSGGMKAPPGLAAKLRPTAAQDLLRCVTISLGGHHGVVLLQSRAQKMMTVRWLVTGSGIDCIMLKDNVRQSANVIQERMRTILIGNIGHKPDKEQISNIESEKVAVDLFEVIRQELIIPARRWAEIRATGVLAQWGFAEVQTRLNPDFQPATLRKAMDNLEESI